MQHRTQTDSGAWFEAGSGAYLLRQERAVLAEVLPTIFGFFIVQVGDWGPPGSLLQTSNIREQFVCSTGNPVGVQLCTQPEYLPFAGDSVDAVLLPHTLERCADPYRVLREVERMLTGEGHLIVLGFHPWGMWAVRQRLRDGVPWGGKYVSARRVREWLAVLGFDTLKLRHYLYRPSLSHSALVRSAFLDRRRWRICAGAYMLVARKRVFAVTPLRLKRTKLKRTFADVVKPTTR